MRVFLFCLMSACLLCSCMCPVGPGPCPWQPHGFPTSLHVFYPSSELFGDSSIPWIPHQGLKIQKSPSWPHCLRKRAYAPAHEPRILPALRCSLSPPASDPCQYLYWKRLSVSPRPVSDGSPLRKPGPCPLHQDTELFAKAPTSHPLCPLLDMAPCRQSCAPHPPYHGGYWSLTTASQESYSGLGI